MESIYREHNHIYFHAEIDRQTISQLCVQLRKADEECILMAHRMRIENVPIYLHIDSDGGCVPSAFAAVDVLHDCRSPVYSVVEGAAASAGTIISVACEKRYIRPKGMMLIHQMSSSWGGKMAELTDEYNNLKDLTKIIKAHYLEYTRLNSKKLEQLLSHDLYLDATQCLEYGLVDELYQSR